MDMNLREINKKNAVCAQPVYGLREHLALKGEAELESLKRLAGSGIEDIYGWLTDPEVFKMLLMAVTPADFELFARAAETTFLQDDSVFLPRHSSLTAFSLMTPFAVGDLMYCVVPSEFKDMWRDLKRLGFAEHKRKRDMLDIYAAACVKLYGVVTVKEFVDIFNIESGGKTDAEEVEGYLRELADGRYYRLEDGMLLNALLPAESAQDYIQARKGMPLYLPRHEKMLQLGEGAYLDVFRELEIYRLEAEDILRSRGVEDAEDKAYLFADTLYLTLSTELEDCEHGELFSEFELMEDAARIRELKNSVRLWANFGHTPNELFEMIKKGEFRPERNGRCPCGSGRKYKKCHGR